MMIDEKGRYSIQILPEPPNFAANESEPTPEGSFAFRCGGTKNSFPTALNTRRACCGETFSCSLSSCARWCT